MLRLSSPITEIAGIGPAKANRFEKLGIRHVRDLLFHFPRRYEDFSEVTAIQDLQEGTQVAVHGYVKSVNSKWGFQGKRRLLRIYVDIEDETGVISVTWFNLRFLPKQLPVGRELYIAGKVEPYKGPNTGRNIKWAMRSPAIEFADKQSDRTHTAAITPIYPETSGISSRFLRYQIKNLLPMVQAIPEYIPEDMLRRNDLMGIHEALTAIHFPKNKKELERANKRLRFDELFFLQLAALVRRQTRQHLHAPRIEVDASTEKRWVEELPFALTGAQQRATEEIAHDMAGQTPMNRLLQGDVGSGKSAVATLAARRALNAGYKVLYLAPTEILARQQAQSLTEQLQEYQIELLVGAMKRQEKAKVLSKMKQFDPLCVVGTHALIQDTVQAINVGLVIVDEQHRFGVAQRKRLQEVSMYPDRGSEENTVPHLLSMTATPIPRTLNLTVYGDLDVSVLDELPPGRKPVTTKIIPPERRDHAVIHTLEQLHNGKQAYVIAPLVEDSDKMELKSAKATYKEMEKLFPGIAVGLVHGQMASEEKESMMRNFAAGAIQLLVSTAVVEVGVNVPNATIMIIEGAERFGLSQLHQFRGRIGRGKAKSYCYLFPTKEEQANSKRLQILEQTTDGFVIAEEDLQLRGPGEVYGVQQSGFGDLKVASLLDYETIKNARTEAQNILQQDPSLDTYPIFKKKVMQKNKTVHFE